MYFFSHERAVHVACFVLRKQSSEILPAVFSDPHAGLVWSCIQEYICVCVCTGGGGNDIIRKNIQHRCISPYPVWNMAVSPCMPSYKAIASIRIRLMPPPPPSIGWQQPTGTVYHPHKFAMGWSRALCFLVILCPHQTHGASVVCRSTLTFPFRLQNFVVKLRASLRWDTGGKDIAIMLSCWGHFGNFLRVC